MRAFLMLKDLEMPVKFEVTYLKVLLNLVQAVVSHVNISISPRMRIIPENIYARVAN